MKVKKGQINIFFIVKQSVLYKKYVKNIRIQFQICTDEITVYYRVLQFIVANAFS